MAAPDPEFSLLRWGAVALLPAGGPLEAPRLEAIDWQRLLWLGRQQGALLLLDKALRPHPAVADRCPADIRAQLAELAAAAQLQALARAAEISRVHDLLAAEAIPLLVSDDWMFQHVFAAGGVLAESTSAIRCAVALPLADRARAVLIKAGYPEAAEHFQVAPTGSPPVLVETGPGSADPASEKISPVLGVRHLPAPAPESWLLLFAGRLALRRPTLFEAWQIVSLLRSLGEDSLVFLERADRETPRLRRSMAASHAQLGLPAPFAVPPGPAASPPPNPFPPEAEPPIAPFLPTPPRVVERMLSLASVGPGDIVYDLGCGDGRVVIAAAAQFGARGFGIDRDPALVAAAAAAARGAGVAEKTTFLCDDLFQADVGAASVICFYLLPALCEPIRRRLLVRARPGTRIVGHDYAFPDWAPEKTELVRTSPARVAQIYLWRVGANQPA